MISNTLFTICKLFKPLYSLVLKCDFVMFHSHLYTCGEETLLRPILSFTTLCFVWLFSFQNHSWYVHGAKQSYHGWNPQDLCTAKINYHQVVMSKEGGGGLSSSLCTYGRIYAIRQEKFLLFSILRYKIDFFSKDWVVVQTDNQM